MDYRLLVPTSGTSEAKDFKLFIFNQEKAD